VAVAKVDMVAEWCEKCGGGEDWRVCLGRVNDVIVDEMRRRLERGSICVKSIECLNKSPSIRRLYCIAAKGDLSMWRHQYCNLSAMPDLSCGPKAPHDIITDLLLIHLIQSNARQSINACIV